jgi:hypothetical protein
MAKERQTRLAGMQDAAIEALEKAALEYAEIRDERQELTRSEVDLKEKLLKLMKKHSKTNYVHGGIEIRIVMEEETVKVRIKKPNVEDVEVVHVPPLPKDGKSASVGSE